MKKNSKSEAIEVYTIKDFYGKTITKGTWEQCINKGKKLMVAEGCAMCNAEELTQEDVLFFFNEGYYTFY